MNLDSRKAPGCCNIWSLSQQSCQCGGVKGDIQCNLDRWVSPCIPVVLVHCSMLAHLVSMPKEHIHRFYLAFQQTQHFWRISWLNREFRWPIMTFSSSSFDKPDFKLIPGVQTSWDSIWHTMSVNLSFTDKATSIFGNDRLKTFCAVARNAGESIVQSMKGSWEM
jgi:hypothetical protein